MAERRHKQETQKAPKTYNIKMPVYTTSMMEQEEGLFGRVTYQDMISLLKERLKSFSSPISTDNRNKTKKMVINKNTSKIQQFKKRKKILTDEQTCNRRKWI